MIRKSYWVSLIALGACAANAAPPVPSLHPDRRAAAEEGNAEAAPLSPTMGPAEPLPQQETASSGVQETVLEGLFVQGGLITGKAPAGTRAMLNGTEILVDPDGNFVFGFGRDHGPTAELVLVDPDGTRNPAQTLRIQPQQWLESSVTVEESKANPYADEDLAKIAADRELKDEARQDMGEEPFWLSGFEWPVDGCISSHFGYRRIVNGTPRRYHSGVDVAAPDGMSPLDYIGTPIYAPAAGQVTLAQDDMFFEGGLVFIDHGQYLESALMHMSEVVVEEGTFVEQGDLIGRVGRSGRVTGPHLHWSLKWTDTLLDPELVVAERAECTD